jgi:hypothetical protein
LFLIAGSYSLSAFDFQTRDIFGVVSLQTNYYSTGDMMYSLQSGVDLKWYRFINNSFSYDEQQSYLIKLSTDFKQFYYGIKFIEFYEYYDGDFISMDWNGKIFSIDKNSFFDNYELFMVSIGFSILEFSDNKNYIFYSSLGPAFGYDVRNYHNDILDKYVSGLNFALRLNNMFRWNDFYTSVNAKFKNTSNFFRELYFNELILNFNLGSVLYTYVEHYYGHDNLEKDILEFEVEYDRIYFLNIDKHYDKASIILKFTPF